jgi:hypothetical protein
MLPLPTGEHGVCLLGCWSTCFSLEDGLSGLGKYSKVVLWGASMWAVAASTANRASLGTRIKFSGSPLFSWKSISSSSLLSSSKVLECAIFTRLWLGCPAPTQTGSAQCTAPSPSAEVKVSLHLFGHQFCSGKCNLPTNYAGLFVSLQSRCLPGSVAVSLGRIESALGQHAGQSLRFCVCRLWQV